MANKLITLSVTVIAILYMLICRTSVLFDQRDILCDIIDDEYDYVIVGGGTAGSVVAARLAEDRENRVLLLEAGGFYDESWMFSILALWPMLQKGQHDWSYYTEPQRYSHFGFKDNLSYWPRGRVLGGSGMINGAQYTRGSRYDFDEWAANGCEGWGYKDVFPYFLKAEDIQIDNLKTSKYHKEGGPMAVSESVATSLANLYMKAGQELGYNITDYNGGEHIGFNKIQINSRGGTRESSAVAYLGRPRKKENLDISINSFVTKLAITDKTATGVYYVRNNRKYFVQAKKEIIISAGSVNSPQLLMLSGIGPKEHLEEMGIPSVADLPVGLNLQDHQVFLLHS
jgi:choline dehydrogenase-like flavoprotein